MTEVRSKSFVAQVQPIVLRGLVSSLMVKVLLDEVGMHLSFVQELDEHMHTKHPSGPIEWAKSNVVEHLQSLRIDSLHRETV